MQHVLRCWERQSDDSDSNTRKPFGGHRWGSLQRSRKPPSWWGGAVCPLPKNPIPSLGPLGLASPTPHSRISSDTVVVICKKWNMTRFSLATVCCHDFWLWIMQIYNCHFQPPSFFLNMSLCCWSQVYFLVIAIHFVGSWFEVTNVV